MHPQAEGFYCLALMYRNGDCGVKKDLDKFYWNIRKAAALGHPKAAYLNAVRCLIKIDQVKRNIYSTKRAWRVVNRLTTKIRESLYKAACVDDIEALSFWLFHMEVIKEETGSTAFCHKEYASPDFLIRQLSSLGYEATIKKVKEEKWGTFPSSKLDVILEVVKDKEMIYRFKKTVWKDDVFLGVD